MRENAGAEVVLVEHGEPAGLLGDDAQAVVLEPHLVHQVRSRSIECPPGKPLISIASSIPVVTPRGSTL